MPVPSFPSFAIRIALLFQIFKILGQVAVVRLLLRRVVFLLGRFLRLGGGGLPLFNLVGVLGGLYRLFSRGRRRACPRPPPPTTRIFMANSLA